MSLGTERADSLGKLINLIANHNHFGTRSLSPPPVQRQPKSRCAVLRLASGHLGRRPRRAEGIASAVSMAGPPAGALGRWGGVKSALRFLVQSHATFCAMGSSSSQS
jgi:hypothetical protein